MKAVGYHVPFHSPTSLLMKADSIEGQEAELNELLSNLFFVSIIS